MPAQSRTGVALVWSWGNRCFGLAEIRRGNGQTELCSPLESLSVQQWSFEVFVGVLAKTVTLDPITRISEVRCLALFQSGY